MKIGDSVKLRIKPRQRGKIVAKHTKRNGGTILVLWDFGLSRGCTQHIPSELLPVQD